jgi:hypothetical protein
MHMPLAYLAGCMLLHWRIEHNLWLVPRKGQHTHRRIVAEAADHNCLEAAAPCHAVYGCAAKGKVRHEGGCSSGKVPDGGAAVL